jgi:hypothetical protein
MSKKSFLTGNDPQVGRSDTAGMPKDVKMEMYPKYPAGREKGLDDTITDIDEVVSRSEGKRSRFVSNQK